MKMLHGFSASVAGSNSFRTALRKIRRCDADIDSLKFRPGSADEIPKGNLEENAMELTPIAGIRAVGLATSPRDECEVQPTFALDPSGRMADDAYKDARQEAERGLEEEDSELAEETDSPSDLSSSSDPESRVSFFA
jgi:hypothetical protein